MFDFIENKALVVCLFVGFLTPKFGKVGDELECVPVPVWVRWRGVGIFESGKFDAESVACGRVLLEIVSV